MGNTPVKRKQPESELNPSPAPKKPRKGANLAMKFNVKGQQNEQVEEFVNIFAQPVGELWASTNPFVARCRDAVEQIIAIESPDEYSFGWNQLTEPFDNETFDNSCFRGSPGGKGAWRNFFFEHRFVLGKDFKISINQDLPDDLINIWLRDNPCANAEPCSFGAINDWSQVADRQRILQQLYSAGYTPEPAELLFYLSGVCKARKNLGSQSTACDRSELAMSRLVWGKLVDDFFSDMKVDCHGNIAFDVNKNIYEGLAGKVDMHMVTKSQTLFFIQEDKSSQFSLEDHIDAPSVLLGLGHAIRGQLKELGWSYCGYATWPAIFRINHIWFLGLFDQNVYLSICRQGNRE